MGFKIGDQVKVVNNTTKGLPDGIIGKVGKIVETYSFKSENDNCDVIFYEKISASDIWAFFNEDLELKEE
jgi:hypothetical protein